MKRVLDQQKTPVKQCIPQKKRKLSLMSSRIGGNGKNVTSSFDTTVKKKKKPQKIIPTPVTEKKKKKNNEKNKISIITTKTKDDIENNDVVHTLTPKRKKEIPKEEKEIIHTLTPKRKAPPAQNINKNEKIHNLVPRKRPIENKTINTLIPRKKKKITPDSENVHILKPKRKSDVALEEAKTKSTPTKRRSSIIDIPQPKKRQRLYRTLLIGEVNYEIEVQNHHRTIGFLKHPIATLSCVVKNNITWTNEVPGQISDLDVNNEIILCGTYKGTIHCFSTQSGRVLLGRHLQISSAAVTKISINKENCAYILFKDGEICFLNINFQSPWNTRLEYRANVSPLLGRGDLINAYFVDNSLIVALSDESLYTYTENLGCWCCLSDNSFFGSRFVDGRVLDKRRLKDVEKQIHTVNHIESEICNNLIMRRPNEFQNWCENYLRELLKKPIKLIKLKEFCDELLQGECKSEFEILSVEWRINLLKQLIPIIAQNRQLERIANRYVALIADKEQNKRILL